MYKVKELRDNTIEELERMHADLCRRLFDLQNDRYGAGRAEVKPHEVKHTKKDIARVLTLITEKRRLSSTQG